MTEIENEDASEVEDDDDDKAPPTASLIRRALFLIAEAAEEAPLSKERYGALKSEVELVCLEADDPQIVRQVIAEPLFFLEPEEEKEAAEQAAGDEAQEAETE